MVVHFYEVRNCTFEGYKGDPVLFAPADTDDDTLMKRGFRRNKEGRWFRPVNMAEYNFISYSAQFGDVTINDANAGYIMNFNAASPYNQKYYGDNTANVLCFVSIGLMASAIPATLLATVLVGGAFFIAAIILMIIVRVRYPYSQFGKVLCIVYIVLSILVILFTIAVMVLIAIICNQMMNDCESCCHSIPG